MKSIYLINNGWAEEDAPKVGKEYILVSKENIMTGSEYWKLVPDNGGIPGNLDSSIRRYHGWRGTTSNISCYAHGVRRVEEVRSEKITEHGIVYKVKLSGDLKPDED